MVNMAARGKGYRGYVVPEKVKTTVERWAVPLGGGALVGFGAYHLAKENPIIYGIVAGAVTAIIIQAS